MIVILVIFYCNPVLLVKVIFFLNLYVKTKISYKKKQKEYKISDSYVALG